MQETLEVGGKIDLLVTTNRAATKGAAGKSKKSDIQSAVSDAEIKDIFDYTEHEFTLDDDKTYDCMDFGIDYTDTWYETFNADPEQTLYIRQMLSNKEKLSQDARIKLSTIHSAKGGEADNVLLILDNTDKIREGIEKSPEKADEEHRVWYVGVTRTKQNLYIMAAKEDRLGYEIQSIH